MPLGRQAFDRSLSLIHVQIQNMGGMVIDAVEQTKKQALLHFDAQSAKRIGEAIYTLGQFAVGIGAVVIEISDLPGPPRPEIALDQIVRRVVIARDVNDGWADAVVGRAQVGWNILRAQSTELIQLDEPNPIIA